MNATKEKENVSGMKKEKDQGAPLAQGKKRNANESHPLPVESYAALFDSSLYSNMKQGYLSSKKARVAKAIETTDVKPIWQGTLTLPTVLQLPVCAWRHGFLGSKQDASLLDELNLPSDLLIKGRIEQSKGLEYLQQVMKSPTRCIALLQVSCSSLAPFLSEPSESAHNKIKSHPALPLSNGGDSETATLSSLYGHFASRQRWGVIYSNLGTPLPGAHSGRWTMKDLYLIPVDKSEPRAPPLNTIDVDLLDSILYGPDATIASSLSSEDRDTHLLYLVAVMGRPSVPPPVKEKFQYRPIDSTRSSSSSMSNSARSESGKERAPSLKSQIRETEAAVPSLNLAVGADFSSTLDSLSAVLGNTDSPLLNDISESIVSSKIKSPAYP